MKKLLALSLTLLLCLTACEPKVNHEVESEFEPETVVETEAEAEAETETETKPKRTPEEKISSPFKGMTDDEIREYMELHYKNTDYYIDVMMRVDVPEPSPELRAEWESMERMDRLSAQNDYYVAHTKPISAEIGIPLSWFTSSPFAGFSFSDAEEYIEFSTFLDLWAKDDRILSISVAIGSMM